MKSRKIILIAFLILVGASIIYALMDQRKVTTSSEKAYQAYLKGEDLGYRLYNNEALQEFEQAAKIDPNFAMAFARMAWLYKAFDRKREYQEAKEKALSLFDKVKDKEKIVINLGFARAEERLVDVERYSKELIAKFPDSFEANEFLIFDYYDRKNYSATIKEILRILKENPNHAPSYNILAYSYFFSGEYDKALESIEKYSSVAQGQANPHDSHGELLLNLGRYDEALQQFRRADSIKPDLYFVTYHIGDVYHAKGMYRDAIGAYLKSLDLSPNEKARAQMDASIALCYIETDQPEKAITILKEAVEKTPDDLRANAILGGVYAETGMMEDALVQLGVVRGVISKLKQSGETNENTLINIKSAEEYLMGKISLAKKDYETAEANFAALYRESNLPERMFFASILGDILEKAGRPDSAVSLLTMALKDNPNSSLCLKALADAYGQLGQRDAQRGALTRYLAVMKDADEGLPSIREASASLERLNSRNM